MIKKDNLNYRHKQKSILIEYFPIQCKMQNGFLWNIRPLRVTTETRLFPRHCIRKLLLLIQ